jgi:hypothetical protein
MIQGDRKGKKWIVVPDGKEGSEYDAVTMNP